MASYKEISAMRRFRLSSMVLLASVFTIQVPSIVRSAEAVASSPLVLNQWVCLGAESALKGSVVLPANTVDSLLVRQASIALVGEDGKVRRAETNGEGQFTFEDVQPGIYAMTARGKDVLSVVALHVIDPAAEGAKSYPTQVEMPAARIDYTTLNTAIIRYLPPDNVMRASVSMKTADLAGLAPKVQTDKRFRISQVDGGMTGRIWMAGADGQSLPAAAGSNVFVLKDGAEVARAVTDEDGRFVIKNLTLGEYSLMTLGVGGLGLVGFDLVDGQLPAASVAQTGANGETLVAQTDCGCIQEFEIQCAPIPEVVSCVEEVIETPCCGEEIVDGEMLPNGFVDGFGSPIPGAGYGPGYGGPGYGGGFGGGGGGFVGGGPGGLLGLAAVGGIAAAAIAAGDDDPVNNPVDTASPAQP